MKQASSWTFSPVVGCKITIPNYAKIVATELRGCLTTDGGASDDANPSDGGASDADASDASPNGGGANPDAFRASPNVGGGPNALARASASAVPSALLPARDDRPRPG
jgi:hypothetical protein